MQLKEQSVESWQNENIIQKIIIPENPILRQEIFKPVDNEVRRSGQVTTFVVFAVFSLSFQAVVLRKLP